MISILYKAGFSTVFTKKDHVAINTKKDSGVMDLTWPQYQTGKLCEVQSQPAKLLLIYE